jgi:hypothetical protein
MLDEPMLNSTNAPYAAKVIPLHLSSVTGMRWRPLYCLECGRQFVERNGDMLYRLNDTTQPQQQVISSSPIPAICGYCSQQYSVMVAIHVTVNITTIPLHLQTQSLYMAIEPSKQRRTIHCLECGHVFQAIADRISQVVDNHLPAEYTDSSKLGSIDTMCSSKHCKQLWAIVV